jgi:hypothetical protein
VSDHLSLEGFEYLSDSVSLRLRCLRCGKSAGIAGENSEYAHGWLDHWSLTHESEAHAPRFLSRLTLRGEGS